MARASGPQIIQNNNFITFDAANTNSWQYHPSSTDHGISDWICMTSSTITYSMPYANTTIYARDINGNVSTQVSPVSTPSRGTFSATTGYIYWGTNAIHLLAEGAQQGIAPLTLSGQYFGHNYIRNNPITYYATSPFGTATVNLYDNVSTGINGTVTSNIIIGKGNIGTFTTNNLSTWSFFTSTLPIVMTATGTGNTDSVIMSPAATTSYNRFLGSYSTVYNTVPSTVSTYYVSSGGNLTVGITIADGAGGDACQNTGAAFFSDTYTWGNSLSDYEIVAPYPNTTISVSYWSGSTWTTQETHNLSGTLTNPAYVARDGSAGVGNAATNITGTANYFASGTTLWLWQGTSPFLIVINDVYDKEERMLGYMAANTARQSSNTVNTWQDRRSLNSAVFAAVPQTSTDGLTSLVFDGVNHYASVGSITDSILNAAGWSMEFWVKMSTVNRGVDNVFAGHGSAVANGGLYMVERNGKPYFGFYTNDLTGNTILISNTWYYLVFTYDYTSKLKSIYVNGVLDSSGGTVGYSGTGSNFTIGTYSWSTTNRLYGNMSICNFYTRPIAASEIQTNFNAFRGRYGL